MTTWPEVPLGAVATIQRDAVDPKCVSLETRYLGLENIESGGRISDAATVGEIRPESLKYRFTQKHVLFGKLRPYLAKVARPDFDGICSTDILPISPGGELDRDYLAHYLLLPETVGLAAARSTGANLPRLSPSELEKFSIPVPPLVVQRRITNHLNTADKLRRDRQEALALLGDLLQSTFLDLFGDPAKDWPVTTVADVAASEAGSIRTGPFGSQLLHDEFVESGIAVLGIDNAVKNEFTWSGRRFITEAKYRQLNRYTVRPGDVLITIMGTCGRCAVVPDDIPVAINTKHLCCITLDQSKCLPEFLHIYFLKHPAARSYLQRAAKGAIMEGLNMGIIKGMPILLPPIDLQWEFVSRARAVSALKSTELQQLAELDALFGSIQYRAFRGDLG
jgi:type I restriction enzyme, S subunit